MAEPKRMSLAEAKAVAGALLEQMRPYCLRAEIAGSIRREKIGDIKDVELVVIADWIERPDTDVAPSAPAIGSLFDDAGAPTAPPPLVRVNRLHEWAMQNSKPGPVGIPLEGICWIKASKPNEAEEWVKTVPDPNGRYWRGLLPNGCTLDLFITETDRWGATFLQRTGSAEFSTEVVTRAKAGRRYRFNNGGLCKWFADGQEKNAELVPTPEERDVFQLLGLAFVLPKERTGSQAVRRLERMRHV